MHPLSSTRNRRNLSAVVAAACATFAFAAGSAGAASVAYIEAGNVWLSSPDGSKKVQLTTTGTPAKPWLGVAQAVDGRTVAVYDNDPGGNANSRLQWFKVWDRSGNEIKALPLQSKNVGTSIVRPLAFEISDDGDWTVNEWSYCVGGYSGGIFYNCLSLPHGAWLTLTNQINLLDPLEVSGARQMTFYGDRLVFSDGSAISVQQAAGAPAGQDSDTWIPPAPGYAFKRADIPATGGKVALEVRQAGGSPENLISVIPYSGDAGTGTVDSANGCDLPASGNAHSVAWSPDGTQIAWRDDEGLKVAGTPVLPWPTATPCSFTSPPVLISGVAAKNSADLKNDVYLTTVGPSFGGADVAAILAARAAKAPAAAPAPAPGPSGTPAPGPTASGGPKLTPPKTQKAAALGNGLSLTVVPAAAGRISAVGTIPASVARRLGIPATVARGSVTAKTAGKAVKLKLKLTKKALRKLKKLRGVKLTVRVTQGSRRSSVTILLR